MKKPKYRSKTNFFAWGIFFFSLWLTLKATGNLNSSQEAISYVFLIISVILFLSIVVPPIARIMSTKTAECVIAPGVFLLSAFSFTLAYTGNLKNMFENNISIPDIWIATIFGFLWLIVWLIIIVYSASILNRFIGLGFSGLYAIIGIYVLCIEPNKWGGVILIILAVILCLVSFRKIPVNYPPIFGDEPWN